MEATEEQSAIAAFAADAPGNFCIDSLAGTGKTATIKLIEQAIPQAPMLYVVFNRRNADEAKDKFDSTTSVKTINGVGHGIWAQALGKKGNELRPNSKKVPDLVTDFIKAAPRQDQDLLWSIKWDVVSAVAMAKAVGYIPDGKFTQAKRIISRADFHKHLDEDPDDLVSDIVDEILSRSITAAYKGSIDWNDQVYMPAMFGGPFPRFPFVAVDEVQDQNPTGQVLIRKLTKGRGCFVGDPYQNIYAFRGAARDGMGTIKRSFSTTNFRLTQSFRCPSEIVKHVHWRVPHFRWSREGGEVEQPHELDASDFPDDAAIICRNNAPLFRTALHLLAIGRGVSVAGSDVGPKLIALLRKLGPEDMSRQRTLAAIDEWEEVRLDKGNTSAHDLAECMRVFTRVASHLGQAIAYAEHVLAQKGKLQLLTGHKAKGLEWDTVYHLDPQLCRDDEQDQNLRYVISTRSANRLVEIESARIVW